MNSSMIEFLASYPLLTLTANLSGLVGVGLAFFFYYRGKERFAISYRATERLLIQSSSVLPFDMDVPLSWKGTEVSRLTRSFILVRNTGNKLIERSDFVTTPLLTVGEASTILEVDLIIADDPGSAIKIGPNDGQYRALDFSFLRPTDGFILKVDHTGGVNEIYLNLKTKAGGPIKKQTPERQVIFWFLGFIICAGVVGNVIWRYAPFMTYPPDVDFLALQYILFSTMVGTGALMLLSFLAAGAEWLFEKMSPTSKVPRRAEAIFSGIASNRKDAARPLA